MQWHDAKEWESSFNTSMLRIVTLNIDDLFEEFKTQDVYHESTDLVDTAWQTRKFAFYQNN